MLAFGTLRELTELRSTAYYLPYTSKVALRWACLVSLAGADTSIILSRHMFCHYKHVFVVTKSVFVETKDVFCRDKSMLAATNLLSRQSYDCCDNIFVFYLLVLSLYVFIH